jgi:hypothetical protein
MRVRIGSAIAVLAAAAGLAAGVAGPVYAAFGGHAASATTTVEASRIMSAGPANPASTNSRIM